MSLMLGPGWGNVAMLRLVVSGRRWKAPRTVVALTLIALTTAMVVSHGGFRSPPRYDGAGYALLGWSLATGQGYREASNPVAKYHSHFPPGYPLILAGLIRGFGPSFLAMHTLSMVFTVAATMAYWAWFRRLLNSRVAFILGATLAINWSWGRIGGSIQSEPLYHLLSALALLTASGGETGRAPLKPGRAIVLGVLLAACILTRHVGVCLAAALIINLIVSRQFSAMLITMTVTMAGLAPWIGWLLWLGQAGRDSQASLFEFANLPSLVSRQAIFYVQRIPDQLFGPYVEVATVYANRPMISSIATWGAAVVTTLVAWGWWRALRSKRRRIAGLLPACTLLLLVVWPFTEAGRFLVPLLPVLLIGAVEGISAILIRHRVRDPRRRAAWLLLILTMPYSVYAIATGRAEAQRRTHRDFDAACAWLSEQAKAPGPVLTHHPADLFWQTGRRALETDDPNPQSIDQLIDRHAVDYLLVDQKPYTNSPDDPLARYVQSRAERVQLVWGPHGAVSIYAVTVPR